MQAWAMWLVVASCNACAGTQVHKCEAGGVVSYQDAPCAAHAREAARWDAPPDPTPPTPGNRDDVAARSGPRGDVDRQSRPRAGNRSARIVREPPRPSACEAAKARREQTLDEVGLKRTFDLLSRLDEQVRKACR